MLILQNEYLIHELADKAGVSPRTIRYYQQEGLIPPPESRGKLAYYNDDHLKRLELIRELKNNYLPLDEIYKQLSSLSSDQVQSLLESHQTSKTKQPSLSDASKRREVQLDADSAQAYITRLLNTQPRYRVQEPQQPLIQHGIHMKKDRSVAGTPAESWKRIELIPGIEIHFKDPLSPIDQSHLEEIIRLARKILL